MRRAFLCYIERERPRPYQPFLHYNSWYDIAWADRKFNEKQSLAAIELFGRELVERRGVRLDSFVFDDGWDDNRTLWGFHQGFPHGFTPLSEAAGEVPFGRGRVALAVGRLRRVQQRRLKYGRHAGLRDQRQRILPGRAEVLRPIPPGLPRDDREVRRELLQIRRRRRRQHGAGQTLRRAQP